MEDDNSNNDWFFNPNDEDSTEEEIVDIKPKNTKILCGALTKKGTKCKFTAAGCHHHTKDKQSKTIVIKTKTIIDSDKLLCGANTSKNKPCKKPVKIKGHKCSYHDKTKLPYHNTSYESTLLKIDCKWDKWSLEETSFISRQLGILIRHAPNRIKNNKPGWIYVYELTDDESDNYWKIGMTTEDDVKDRLKKWPGSVLRYHEATPFSDLTERLVHTILDTQRLLRYVYKPAPKKTSGKMYITRFKVNDELIVDKLITTIRKSLKPAKSFLPITKKAIDNIRDHKPVNVGNRTKEIEWFLWDFDIITDVIDTVLKALDDWKKANK